MTGLGLRRRIKPILKPLVVKLDLYDPPADPEPAREPTPQPAQEMEAEQASEADQRAAATEPPSAWDGTDDDWKAQFEAALQELEEEEVDEPEPAPADEPAPEPEPASAEESPSGGRPFTTANVQQVLDDMVRPALQADGGDITLVKLEDMNVYVELVGACSSCPSSIMTMKMGVDRLLHEEFPQMGELIQVNEMAMPQQHAYPMY